MTWLHSVRLCYHYTMVHPLQSLLELEKWWKVTSSKLVHVNNTIIIIIIVIIIIIIFIVANVLFMPVTLSLCSLQCCRQHQYITWLILVFVMRQKTHQNKACPTQNTVDNIKMEPTH